MILRECDLTSKTKQNIGAKCTLISAVSFESRSIAGSKYLAKSGLIPQKHYVFDYDTIAEPYEKDVLIRENQRKHFSNCFGQECKTTFLSKFPPFSISQIHNKMYRIFSEGQGESFYIDITCLTRVHLLAIVSALLRLDIEVSSINFLYSSPSAYAFEASSHIGWQDIIHVPIVRPNQMTREGHAIGIVLPGHDAERLAVALEELEPFSGIVVFANTPQRPDFLARSRETNKYVIDRLKTLSLNLNLRDSLSTAPNPRWSFETSDIFKSQTISRCVDDAIKMANEFRAPLVLFPFGPKIHTLIVAIHIAHAKYVDSYVVYPVPTRFQVGYTEGIGETKCFYLGNENIGQQTDAPDKK